MSKKRALSESGSSDGDLDEQLLSLAKKKPSTRPPSDDDDSDSSTDDGDDEWTVKSDGNMKKENKKNATSNKTCLSAESSSEEGEINEDDDKSENGKASGTSSSSSSSSGDSDGELPAFDDGLDDNLMGDENDRKKLEQMTEKEREQELFNRLEKREALKTRREIEHKLHAERNKEEKQKKKERGERSETEKSELFSETISSRKESRKKTVDDKKKSAMDILKQKRLEKKEKMDALIKKKEPLTTKDVYSDDDDNNNDKENKNSSSDSSDSSDSSSDDEESVDDEYLYIENLDQLEQIRLSRHKLEQWVHLPFFSQIVIGCFIRMGIGNHLGRAIYRVVEIISAAEAQKVYLLGKTRTNKVLKVKHGLQERVFRMEYISNQPFAESEFQKWKDEMKLVELPLPSIKQLKQKSTELSNSKNYTYKEGDIEAIVQEKSKFRKNPVNYAMKKNDLFMAKTRAEQSQDTSEIENINKELADLEDRAILLDKQRTGNLGKVNSINERNRKKNIVDAEKAVVEEAKSKSNDSNPFTRRRTLPKMITKPMSEEQKVEKATPTAVGKTQEGNSEIDSLFAPVIKVPGTSSNNTSGDSDMFNVHDFDVQIDVATFESKSLPVTPKPTMGNSNGISFRRCLNLDEYKKRKGLM